MYIQDLSRRDFLKGGLTAVAGLGLVGLAGCSGSGDGSQDAANSVAGKDTLVMISMVQNDNFSPFASVGQDKPVHHALFDNLYRFDNDGNVEPMLVVDEQEDGLVKTLTIRDDAKFSDGNPVTAADVAFSWETMAADETSGAFVKSYIANVEAVDDHTVKVTAADPNKLWRNYLAEAVYVVEKATYDASKDYTSESPTGSGAYVLDSVDNARTVTLKANESYWNGAPAIKTVQVKAPVDGSTSLVALQTGEADYVAQLPIDNVANAKEDDSLAMTNFTSWSQELLGMYVGDAKFREAVFHAIDRDKLIELGNGGSGTPATDMLSKKVMGKYEGISTFTGYDLDLAKQCIAESQTDLSQTFEILTFDSANVAQVIQEDLKEIGVNVQISQVDANTFFSQLTAGSMQMFLTGLGTDLQTADAMLQLLFGPASIYKYPVTDDFKAKISALTDAINAGEEDLSAQIKDICDAMAVECPIVPLYDIDYHDVYRKGLNGVLESSSGTYVFYFGDMSFEG